MNDSDNVMLSARVPAELIDLLSRRAEQEERSLSGEVRLALREHLRVRPLEPGGEER
jgi:hypothetical protein